MSLAGYEKEFQSSALSWGNLASFVMPDQMQSSSHVMYDVVIKVFGDFE